MATTPAVELQVGDRLVRVSSPDRVVFPGVGADEARGIAGLTKLDVVEYFLAVGPGILGALLERPTTLERWPKGWFEGARLSTRIDSTGDAFFQKRVPQGAPEWVTTARIAFPSGRTADEICPRELAVVIWCANMGTLTFHPWPVTSADVESPDQLRIDLDPQPGTGFEDAARVAPVVREVLGQCGMTGYPKTSGGRGIHVFVPIEPRWTFTQARRATIALGREVERRLPGLVTTKWWKEERGQTIFVDYNQMARDRTIASAYSVRANRRATVSAPLTWAEVDDGASGALGPDDFTVLTMPPRFAQLGDLFAPVVAGAAPRYSLEPLLEMAARDERDHGAGDLPYPPEYPKMPGEPRRVQPSRARPTTSE